MLPELNEIDLEHDIKYGKVDDFGIGEHPTSIVTHLPTGLIAECNYERSWMYNRKIALGMLTQKVHDHYNSMSKSGDNYE